MGADIFVAPNASVIGNVTLGDQSSVWYNAVLRGARYCEPCCRLSAGLGTTHHRTAWPGWRSVLLGFASVNLTRHTHCLHAAGLLRSAHCLGGLTTLAA